MSGVWRHYDLGASSIFLVCVVHDVYLGKFHLNQATLADNLVNVCIIVHCLKHYYIELLMLV